ncbi:MAG: helix-turn-helix transcriptional regulator [Pseudomonadota bacterium]|nr:helix-turn-helix transcriptional regulator [Pseudomonadota bacterium]
MGGYKDSEMHIRIALTRSEVENLRSQSNRSGFIGELIMATVMTATPIKVRDADRGIGQLVRQSRRRVGMTLDDLAKKLGLSYQQVHKYENGTNRISAGTLAAIANILSVPIDHLFPEDALAGGEGENSELDQIRNEVTRLVRTIDDPRKLEAIVTILKTV